MTWGRRFITGIVVATLLPGCAARQKPQTVVPTGNYDVTSEGHFPPAPDVAAMPPPSGVDTGAPPPADDPAPPPSAASSPTSGSTDPRPGWRVQVFAGASRDAAHRVAQQLQATFSTAVYIDYVEPYYKVRLGDCASRDDCASLQATVRERGWTSAWVVPSVIRH